MVCLFQFECIQRRSGEFVPTTLPPNKTFEWGVEDEQTHTGGGKFHLGSTAMRAPPCYSFVPRFGLVRLVHIRRVPHSNVLYKSIPSANVFTLIEHIGVDLWTGCCTAVVVLGRWSSHHCPTGFAIAVATLPQQHQQQAGGSSSSAVPRTQITKRWHSKIPTLCTVREHQTRTLTRHA